MKRLFNGLTEAQADAGNYAIDNFDECMSCEGWDKSPRSACQHEKAQMHRMYEEKLAELTGESA